MKEVLTENSILRYSKSLVPSVLKVTSQSFSKVEGLLVATEADNKKMENILSFGNCLQCNPSVPCVPEPIKWDTLSDVFIVGSNKCLTVKSTIQCAKGGEILIL
ncbi:DUF4280 domain-containing protein [Capnocytophaga cynodegmi]|uniref:DUF4280 domain-containing protein n=1 Tax=Capnocytophaga cynodegmi TaxID=28189 RepID=UPI001AC36420|nr:DUF4280 domain-containing protein [Capnocytophaga cynodegmi]GIM54295.1 hypothetical protein CAPN005_09420 [Capnocytophaga cynodegmi]